MARDPYHRGKPTPKARPALPSAAAEEGAPTLVHCPLCACAGMVLPEVAAAFENFCRDLKGQA